jgi:hypothetical protein
MISPFTAMLALTGGFAVYAVIAFAAMGARPGLRKKIGSHYLKMAMRTLGQAALVRRQMGYDLIPLKYDDEQKLMKVTLSSSKLPGSSDNVHRFKDPDGRAKRLWQKPFVVTDELIPAALDAELSELGYWLSEKRVEEGLVRGDKVDPWINVKSDLRLADPRDALTVVCNGVQPERIKTVEQITKKRFEKYGSRVNLEQTLRVVIGFAVGAGSVIGMNYFTTEIMDGSSSVSGPVISNPVVMIPQPALDVMVVSL